MCGTLRPLHACVSLARGCIMSSTEVDSCICSLGSVRALVMQRRLCICALLGPTYLMSDTIWKGVCYLFTITEGLACYHCFAAVGLLRVCTAAWWVLPNHASCWSNHLSVSPTSMLSCYHAITQHWGHIALL